MTLEFIKFEFVTLRKRRQISYIKLILLFFIQYQIKAQVSDDNKKICGELKVFQQSWFSKHAITLSTQKTSNLSQCISQCCIINNCNALSYVGFLNKNKLTDMHSTKTNCFLFKCSNNLTNLNCNNNINEQTNLSNISKNNIGLLGPEGILSIRILNKTSIPLSKQNFSKELSSAEEITITKNTIKFKAITTTTTELVLSKDFNQKNIENTIKEKDNENQSKIDNHDNYNVNTYKFSKNNSFENNFKNLTKELMFPVWVYGFIIVISVFFGGLSIAAIGAYCCYKWQKTKKQKTFFNSSVPTLHAFNPTF